MILGPITCTDTKEAAIPSLSPSTTLEGMPPAGTGIPVYSDSYPPQTYFATAVTPISLSSQIRVGTTSQEPGSRTTRRPPLNFVPRPISTIPEQGNYSDREEFKRSAYVGGDATIVRSAFDPPWQLGIQMTPSAEAGILLPPQNVSGSPTSCQNSLVVSANPFTTANPVVQTIAIVQSRLAIWSKRNNRWLANIPAVLDTPRFGDATRVSGFVSLALVFIVSPSLFWFAGDAYAALGTFSTGFFFFLLTARFFALAVVKRSSEAHYREVIQTKLSRGNLDITSISSIDKFFRSVRVNAYIEAFKDDDLRDIKSLFYRFHPIAALPLPLAQGPLSPLRKTSARVAPSNNVSPD